MPRIHISEHDYGKRYKSSRQKFTQTTEIKDTAVIGCFQPGALHPVTTATIKAQTCFCLFGLWPKIQATRFAGGR
jgi:hypothetical protein